MLVQILLGAALLIVNTLMTTFSALAMLRFARRYSGWLSREPHDLKLILAASVVSVWMLAIITASVTIWATTFRLLQLFPDMESAVYFSLVVYTTLGFGDVTLTTDWRIFGVVAAVNGLLNIGLLTAIMMETLRNIRVSQQGHQARIAAAELTSIGEPKITTQEDRS